MDNDRGYTFVELMVTVALVVIITTLCIPSLNRLGDRFKLKGAANGFYGTFQRARMDAMKSGASYSVVFGQNIDGSNYDLVLFQDTNANCSLDGGEPIVKRVQLASTGPNIGIGGNTFPANGDGLSAVRFNPKGLPRNSGGGFGSGSVMIRDGGSGHTIAIDVSPLGEVHVGKIS